MTSPAASRFEEAEKHARELNERQRHVLDLLVKGRTNGEIATQLGITLDGAKWNVSEILGKLGLASREEAAEYWRWHKRPGRRLAQVLRGLAAVPALKLAAGGAAAVAAVGAGLTLWLALAGGGAEHAVEGAGQPFYLEAQIDVTTPHGGGGYPPGSPLLQLPDRHTVSSLRWWYQDQDHMRWEVETLEPALQAKTLTVVDDGKYEWSYDSLSNTYHRTDLLPLPPGVPRNIAMSILLGPSPWPTLDAVIEGLEGWSNGRGEVRVAGEEELLGRKTTIIEVEPISYSSDASGKETGNGIGRYWLDETSMMFLKFTAEKSSTDEYSAEVTRLDLGVRIPKDKLSYAPPAGAQQGTGNSTSGGSDGTSALPPIDGPQQIHVPPGFLSIQAPERWREISTMSTDGGDGQPGLFEVDLVNDAGQYLQVQQQPRRDGLPAALKTGQPVVVDGVTAYRSTSNGANRLAFERNGVSVVLTSDGMSLEELQALASRMTPM